MDAQDLNLQPTTASTTEGLTNQSQETSTPQDAKAADPHQPASPTKTGKAAKEVKQPFTESEKSLDIKDSDVGANPEKFLTEVLNKLKHKATITSITMDDEDEGTYPFDFSQFSEQLAEHLPNVASLDIGYMKIINFRIESNTITSLTFNCPVMKDDEWEVKCPNLKSLDMQHHSPPADNFAQAMINCPRIEYISTYKFWHQKTLPALYLPNCKTITFWRGDATSSLKLYAPRLECLNFDTCFHVSSVKMLKRGHKDHKEWNLPQKTEQSKFFIELSKTTLTSGAVNMLRKTGRVMNLDAFNGNHGEDDGCALM